MGSGLFRMTRYCVLAAQCPVQDDIALVLGLGLNVRKAVLCGFCLRHVRSFLQERFVLLLRAGEIALLFTNGARDQMTERISVRFSLVTLLGVGECFVELVGFELRISKENSVSGFPDRRCLI